MPEIFDGFGTLVAAHARLALSALLSAMAIGLPLSVVGHRRPGVGRALVAAAAIVQTIPALALLAVMVPLLASMSLPSIGAWPAWIGLTLYGIFPILQNGITGLQGVDPALRTAARAVGMTPRQSLWRVELPIALPTIVTGIRTAAVWMMGMATLSTPIGAPSLGNPIFAGLQMRRYDLVLLGCVGAAVLALTLDALIRAVEFGIRNRRTTWRNAGLATLGLAALASTLPLWISGAQATVHIGAKTFTEQYVVSAIVAQELEAVGEQVELTSSLGSTAIFDALRAGEIDLYVEYSGTIWATLMHHEQSASRDEVLQATRTWLREHDIEPICTLGFENTYALAVRGVAAQQGLLTLPQLAARAPQWVIGGDYEFFERAEWSSLRDTYGLRFREQRTMDPSLMVDALARGDVDVISAYSTDARLAALGHVVLSDPRQAIPPYDAMLLANASFARSHPRLIERLRALDGTIDADAMRAMNLQVDGEGKSPAAVARAWREAR